ncbi:MAG: DUF4271 domain-containing protein [Paludibacteraceae bacterium]|nr:DUF4271 domain-containing protein [Paludibacteraceae bacterium]
MSAEKDRVEKSNSMEDDFSEDVVASVDSLIHEVTIEEITPYSLEEGMDDYFTLTMGSINRIKSYARPLYTIEGIPSKEGVERIDTFRQQMWFTPLMVVLSFTVGMLLTRRFKLYIQAIKTFFFMTNSSSNFSNTRMGLFQFQFLTFSVSAISVTLFCSFILEDMLNFVPQSFLLSFVKLLCAVLLYVMVKLILNRIVCYVFFNRTLLDNINKQYLTLITMFGFSLFFVDILVAYGPAIMVQGVLWIGILICCLAVILYLYKIFEIFFTGVTSLFYLILYLCTLEILPTVVFVWGLIISV